MRMMSTRKWVSLCCALVLGLTLWSPQQASAQSSNPLANVKSYKIYYDMPTKAKIKKMQQYDMVIIEPVYYTATQIKELQKYGTKVYGYINTMEADNWNVNFIKQMKQSDFFYRNGKRVHYATWDSYLVDMTSTHYRSLLRREVNKQIVAKGLDGAFLDTVGNIDNEHSAHPATLKAQRNGMRTFMKSIKAHHPSLSLIQNWGFATLQTHTSPYVDGIMWEGFNYRVVSKDQWSKDRMKELRKLDKTFGIKTLTVSSTQRSTSASYAKKNGFIHFHTNPTSNYNQF
ncbi:endo alpha-1,4 polygalactosaminidase [Exiguobacterium sp. SL-9]|uniref:endo alpha-1,4 polygalactosaminidase n=1 Tax=Exiguobacterium sp. SL-9 TaxID=2510963 RepID=UPI00103FF71D|nr:endo alpha-1,4 polygalactosaminidase [Exiguobacterium sp. SL-9]TCI21699.1 glycosyl hydrolase [Exiguobacterium sp. SL-9]